MELSGDAARDLSRKWIDTYFRTAPYPYTRHHIDSYDQFVQEDLVSIIRSQNPVVILKDLIDKEKNIYKYRVEIYIGGEDASEIEIGTPTLYHQLQQEVRVLFPNEARLRNLTYASTVYANIVVKIQYVTETREVKDLSPPPETFAHWPIFRLPIMLHSRYCILHNKPKAFLREAGECPYDHGGYFIIDGAEKVLVTRQEQAFNTLYITPQTDPKVSVYASIECLSAKTRQVKRVAFALMRHIEANPQGFGNKLFTKPAVFLVSLPFVRKPVPLFVLFRALGFQSDEEILRLIFPDFTSPEAKFLLPKLQPSIVDAFPFVNTFTAIQYIKTLTKGFSEAHVLDIIRNQLFIHMPNDSTSQALFLGDCVRRILRVSEGYDSKTDRDDTRNQRCLTSGFLLQELFNNSYKLWIKAFALAIDREYNLNKGTLYKDEQFRNIFEPQNGQRLFVTQLLHDMINKGFKGKWGTGLGEDKSGVLQAMSRLSYVDFLSHCRRVILDFDTSMKLTGPRKLHTSQYGYFCTSETPTGASIGITKNLSILTALSTASQTPAFFSWLRSTGRVFAPEDITLEQRVLFIPVYINGGVFGYTDEPRLLTTVLRLFKRTGCLPYSASITFSIRDRRVYLYMDAGRPLRPLVWLESNGANPSQTPARFSMEKVRALTTWRDLVMGRLEARRGATLSSTDFFDPLLGKGRLDQYAALLEPYAGLIEYIDPYEQNEAFIANHPVYLRPESTHMEIHPSTIMSMMTSLIPFAPHNQSPRNQLSCSQSKQGLSIYATNWRNRFDNTAHVLCYGEMPLTRTIYNNYLGEGKMAYGMNCILAIACWSGYNQEDGIVMNYDAVQRGMFRSMAFRSYQAFEEDDEKAGVRVRFGHPGSIAGWKDLRPGLDYSKLDERGIIREGEYVDETTVIVGAYMTSITGGQVTDASTTPQVWTRGRVEKVAVMVSNAGLRLVKIRVVQDRIPELGDKFCLSADHEVKTSHGWKPIAEITEKDHVAQLHPDTHEITFVPPIATHVFPHKDEMYLLQTPYGSHYMTAEHRVYGRFHVSDTTEREWIRAGILYELYASRPTDPPLFFLYDEICQEIPLVAISQTPTNLASDHVYCLSVPTEIFLARRAGESVGYWTGNSNRHGQKGTIGTLLRGHDMPRTESGIVPDMIMNPHAIPSRMTIAQNLEQLLGKTAALVGAIGDGTSFMNDGSPQEAMGDILETIGFEKYGNEVMYNGATGEQLEAAIFIGPVYGMRLKHMVEDKWNARGKGRKEARTHQPTGGRGAQGGLKIGEMDRDAIIAHGGMAFVKESYMERSDGTTISICTSCGTVPIYNPKLQIRMCPMCDGPVRYAGDTVHNLELLPPLGRPKANIVQVEMPYSTKLLTQEQETYLNLSTRFITTRGVQRLTPFEYSKEASEAVKELPRIKYPSTTVASYVEEPDRIKMTQEEYRQLAVGLQEKKDQLDLVEDGEAQSQAQTEVALQQQQDALEQEQGQGLGQGQNTQMMMVPVIPMNGMGAMGATMVPAVPAPMVEQSGGMLPPGGPSMPTYVQAQPGGGPMIAVDTNPDAFERDGILMGSGMGRVPRRNPFRAFGGGMGGGGPAAPPAFSASMDPQQAANIPVRVNKME